MNLRFLLILFLALIKFTSLHSEGSAPGDDASSYATHFVSRENWAPWPRSEDREAWNRVIGTPERAKFAAAVIGTAEGMKGKPWPELKASQYMEFVRTGSREGYEIPHHERRARLALMVLAECFEGEGRFLNEIIDGLWLICEETTWEHSAHVAEGDWRNRLLLPNPAYHFVDIYACDTALILAEATYLFENQFNAMTPYLVRRIHKEIRERIVEPIEKREDHFWWHGLNNHNTWCSATALGAAMYILEDKERLAHFTARLNEQVESFMARRYGNDGHWEEGPGYWNHSTGKIFLFYDFIRSRSNQKIDPFKNPKLQAMGEFIVNSHLGGRYFLSFGDVISKPDVSTPILYRFGDRIESDAMKTLALELEGQLRWKEKLNGFRDGESVWRLYLELRRLFWIPPDSEPEPLVKNLHTWWPDNEEMIARTHSGPEEGLVLIGKAAHNHQSHNQNDVGQFSVYLQGKPIIVDLGKGSYSKKVFSGNRWDVWWIRGSGHNAPVIDGFEQINGRPGAQDKVFSARDVLCSYDGILSRMSMDISPVYPEKADIREVRRVIQLDRERSIISLEDKIRTNANHKDLEIKLTLFSPAQVQILEGNRVLFGGRDESLTMSVDKHFEIELERLELDDANLRKSWGTHLYRITLTSTLPNGSADYKLFMQPGEMDG